MTFSCKNYDYNEDQCLKLKADCVPGRPGCVLEGKVKVSEDLDRRLRELEEKTAAKKRKR
ncbi:hypothetical protein ACUUL3_06750 [Thiovibrio sp. JS02]